MSHSSHSIKDEYNANHETDITIKMANLWEKKIGSEKVHTRPSSTIVNSSVKATPISSFSTEKPENTLHKLNTKEIVNSFEKMASYDGAILKQQSSSHSSNSSMKQLPVQRCASDPGPIAEINKIVNRALAHVASLEKELSDLRKKVDGL